MQPTINAVPDIAKNTELLLFWGCDPETTPVAFDGQLASRLCYWWSDLGIKSVYICPDLNYGAAVHADKWIPVKPNTDAALMLGIPHVWLSEGTYDKEYVKTHTYGFDKFVEYVDGTEDGIPKTPAWAADKTGIPEAGIKALAREWASKRTSIVHGNGGPSIRGPYATERGRLEVLCWRCRGGQTRRASGQDDRVGAPLGRGTNPIPWANSSRESAAASAARFIPRRPSGRNRSSGMPSHTR
jgi:trimethylamine-N-oxide reductase (cytochrome c)